MLAVVETMSKVGKIIRFVNNAMDKLTGISTPCAFVPPDSEKVKITHPKNRLIRYIAPVPASLYTALGGPAHVKAIQLQLVLVPGHKVIESPMATPNAML